MTLHQLPAARPAADPRDSEAICDFCDKRTFGDHRLISMAHTISVACGSCTDHWDDEYRREVGET